MFISTIMQEVAINLIHIESINITQTGKNEFEVRAWNLREDYYVLGRFNKKEDAVNYIYAVCSEFNEALRGRKDGPDK